MNYDSANDATNLPVTLENESTPGAAISTVAATTAITPDAHFLSSGLKLDTDIFLKVT